MNHTDTGGAAFPHEQTMNPDATWNQTGEPGMTLRDYFAAHAPDMPEQWWKDTKHQYGDRVGSDAEAISAWRFFYADAMLKAREAGDGES